MQYVYIIYTRVYTYIYDRLSLSTHIPLWHIGMMSGPGLIIQVALYTYICMTTLAQIQAWYPIGLHIQSFVDLQLDEVFN